MEQRLNSDKVLDIVEKHKESVKGYVRRHDLDIYQINKLIKAETSMQDRNSVLNFLRKEKEKIMQHQPRNRALKQDLREEEEHINRKTGRDTLNDLKDDLIDIRQQITEINTNAVDENTAQEAINREKTSKKSPEDRSQGKKGKNKSEKAGDEKNDSVLPEEVKSRQKMEEEVEHHFDSLPSDREDSGIVSSFKDLFSGEEDVSDLVDNLKPVDIFDEIKDKSDREKAVKAAYTVKKCLENSQGEEIGYGEISSMVRNGELPVDSDAVADMFNYLNEYDYGPEFDFEDVDEAVSNCRALVHRLT